MRLLALLILLLYGAWACSTPQVLDELSYEGEMRVILDFPLEKYFEQRQSYPTVFSSEGIRMSANWRGHRATWEIRNGILLLTGVLKLYGDPRNSKSWEWKDITRTVFPDQKLPIPASWYTGVIRIPDGKQIECFAFSHANDREKEVRIRLQEGVVTEVETRLNTDKPIGRCN